MSDFTTYDGRPIRYRKRDLGGWEVDVDGVHVGWVVKDRSNSHYWYGYVAVPGSFTGELVWSDNGPRSDAALEVAYRSRRYDYNERSVTA